MAHACCCLKKNRQPCSIEADRQRDGKWFCHIHDPRGNFQTNNPSNPELNTDDASPSSEETLMKNLDLLTLRVEALEHDQSLLLARLDALERGGVHAGDEWKQGKPANDDCPFTPTN